MKINSKQIVQESNHRSKGEGRIARTLGGGSAIAVASDRTAMQRLRLRSEIGRAATESRLLREREREGEEREGRETVDGFEAERKIGTLATASMDPAEMKLEVRCLP